MAISAEVDRLHSEAVNNFIKLGLSYRFSATLLNPEEAKPIIRFLFSKPTPQKPEPEITVYLDLMIEKEEAPSVTYALYFEGQKYKRLITMDSSSVQGDEFNEKLLDKIFKQKEVVRERHRWEVHSQVRAT